MVVIWQLPGDPREQVAAVLQGDSSSEVPLHQPEEVEPLPLEVHKTGARAVVLPLGNAGPAALVRKVKKLVGDVPVGGVPGEALADLVPFSQHDEAWGEWARTSFETCHVERLCGKERVMPVVPLRLPPRYCSWLKVMESNRP